MRTGVDIESKEEHKKNDKQAGLYTRRTKGISLDDFESVSQRKPRSTSWGSTPEQTSSSSLKEIMKNEVFDEEKKNSFRSVVYNFVV